MALLCKHVRVIKTVVHVVVSQAYICEFGEELYMTYEECVWTVYEKESILKEYLETMKSNSSRNAPEL
jgi:hypothetical protein